MVLAGLCIYDNPRVSNEATRATAATEDCVDNALDGTSTSAGIAPPAFTYLAPPIGMLAFRFSGQGLNLLARGGDQSRRRADLAEADANQSPKNGCDCAAWQNKCSCGTRKDRPGRKRYCDTRLEGTRHDLPDPDRERTEHKQDHDNYRPRYAANDTTVPGFRDVADETLESIPMSETCAVSDHSTTGLDARQITPLDFGGSVRHRRGTSLAAHGRLPSGSVVWGGPSWGLSPHSSGLTRRGCP